MNTPNNPHNVPETPQNAREEASTVGMAGGALAGAAAGAAIGAAAAGPVGVIAGGVIGALTGGVVGYTAVDSADPNYAYWEDSYQSQPGYRADYDYTRDYSPAYRLGYQGRGVYAGRSWDESEADLARDWDTIKGDSRLTWEEAKASARSAWHRVEEALPGDADGDGR